MSTSTSFVVHAEQAATLAGISAALHQGQRAVGFSALKGGTFLVDEVAELQRQLLGAVLDNWSIETEFHFGGFARRTPELDDFVRFFTQAHGLTLDWVYVAKMMSASSRLLERGDVQQPVPVSRSKHRVSSR